MPIETKRFRSFRGKNVVLTSERLEHIFLRHVEMKHIESTLTGLIKKTVEDPDYVILGIHDEHIAIRYIEGLRKHLVVPYEEDGGVKTAFITSKADKVLKKRKILWKC